MKLTTFSLFVFLLFSLKSQAQTFEMDSIYFDSIQNIEYQLEGLSNRIIAGEDENMRMTSCYYFIQTLKKALLVPQSFHYDFKMLKTISILKPPDESFRIFTWNLLLDSNKYKYFGVIQMAESDSLVIYGLYDSSQQLKKPQYETCNNRHWYGALYYAMNEYGKKKDKYYVLLGWNGGDYNKNEKLIDVLWFDEDNKPQFGKPIFIFDTDTLSRILLPYSEKAAIICRFEGNKDRIVFSNVQPPSPILKGKYEYYLPDGTYDFLQEKKGYWTRYHLFFKDKAKNSNKYRKR